MIALYVLTYFNSTFILFNIEYSFSNNKIMTKLNENIIFSETTYHFIIVLT